MDNERNLLFGVLALQADLIDAVQFAEACTAWSTRKETSMGELLLERGWITREDQAHVEYLLERKLKRYGGDVQASLAAVTDDEGVRRFLLAIDDEAIQQSLANLTPPVLGGDPGVTRSALFPLEQSPSGRPMVSTFTYETQTRDRYRLIHLHAVGGIGQIWLTRDGDLGRTVALKELRPEAAQSPKMRARFLEEAQITGQLEHPGIVPVYELCRRVNDQQPFYTMRFLRGRTLTEAVRVYHQKRVAGNAGPLDLLGLLNAFVGVCNAMAYAHTRGVIHRDLKGQNVILGDFGEVIVLDWGLAKVLSRPASDSEMEPVDLEQELDREQTLQGQVLGTPAYMAPEQAAGRQDLVNNRADVYGLGAVLYEILTGRPPFSGASTNEVLKKVQGEEPVRPRQIWAGVPPALEAISLRALAKKRQARYASAQELAQEVRRWLADEPVNAYPEPWTVQGRRWLRRHRPVVAAAAALLLTAVVALSISTFLIRQREQAAQEARQQAEQQRDRADRNLRLARKAVDKTVTKITNNPRLKEADFHELRRELLQYMVPFYEEFVKQRENDPELEAERGEPWSSLARLREEMGDREGARSDYRQVSAIFEHLAADFPAVPDYRLELARSQNRLGLLLRDLGERSEAEAAYQYALKIQGQLAADFPKVPQYRQDLATSRNNLGVLMADLGKRSEAEASYREALKIRAHLADEFPTVAPYRIELAASHNDLGMLLRDVGKRAEAEAACREALKIQRQLAADFPKVPLYRQDLANSHNNLAVLLTDLGRREEAETACREALTIQRQLAVDFPSVPQYRLETARSHNNLGVLLYETGKYGEAEAAFRETLNTQAQLAAEFPKVPQYRLELAASHNNLGILFRHVGRREEAEAAYRDGLRIRAQLATDFPSVPEYQRGLAASQDSLAELLHDLGKRTEAEAACREALKIETQLAADFPKVPRYREQLAKSHNHLGVLLYEAGKCDQAEAAHREAVKILTGLAADFPKVPEYRQRLAGSHCNLGSLLRDQGKHPEAEAAYRQALEIQTQLVRDFPTVSAFRNDLAGTMDNQALLLRQSKKLDQARQLLEDALPHHQAALQADPRNLEYRQVFRNNRVHLGIVLLDLGEHAAAARTAGELMQAAVDPARDVYNAACMFAVCASLAERDSRLSESQRREHAQAYRDRALATLRQAVQNGYKDAAHIKKNPDLNPLRPDPDFQKLLQELEAKPTAQPK